MVKKSERKLKTGHREDQEVGSFWQVEGMEEENKQKTPLCFINKQAFSVFENYICSTSEQIFFSIHVCQWVKEPIHI